MKNQNKKKTLAVVVFLLCIGMLSGSVALAKSNLVDSEGQGNPKSYKGRMSLATNTNFDIEGDEEFNAELQTGETKSSAETLSNSTSKKEEDSNILQCVTMHLHKENVDFSAIEDNMAKTPKKAYAVGDTKVLSMIKNSDYGYKIL